ncbi:hypothetical protein CP533_2456 [Ophiocordyceps camponoti-saundersi (nom. inval.)]|nr:hypothetical protein CP533_2456 [Ophiocordyceps camponoti-saundersi (nom. inval.)]
MKGRHVRPARVYRAVTLEIRNNVLKDVEVQKPAWFDVMHSVPPAETLVRTISPRHAAFEPKTKRPRNLYRPQPIFYLEDKLRAVFYKDHPWELARPRVFAETDGKDYQRCDWSKGLRQPEMALSGECVVQRQMWLMKNEEMSENEAYDKARYEFYDLRMAEEIEHRIAIEEARYVGAYFGKSRLEIGMMLEDEEYERWKKWAEEENALAAALNTNALDDVLVKPDSDGASGEVEADMDEFAESAVDLATPGDQESS